MKPMAERKKCPECNSENVRFITKDGKKHLVCNHCIYDETEEFDVYPEEKTNQKEKGRYSPYKAGGPKR